MNASYETWKMAEFEKSDTAAAPWVPQSSAVRLHRHAQACKAPGNMARFARRSCFRVFSALLRIRSLQRAGTLGPRVLCMTAVAFGDDIWRTVSTRS